VMQDPQGSVTAVDVKTMKAIAHYPLGDKGRCNGLAFDAKNHVLFAACAASGNPPAAPPQPMMVILRADDGKILTSLPLAGGSDGAPVFAGESELPGTYGEIVSVLLSRAHRSDAPPPGRAVLRAAIATSPRFWTVG